MRKLDCVEIKTCKCSCQNCLQYRSSKTKNRESLIMQYVREYKETESALVKETAKKNLTEKEYRVFLFEIENRGV